MSADIQSALVIDDEATCRGLMTEWLRALGWQVWEAATGQEGIALALKHRPRVVFCDLMMPRGNGFQVCRSLRAAPTLRHTRLIVTSGRDFAADRREAQKAGAEEYLVKPVSRARLAELLARCLAETSSDQPAWLRFWGVRGSIPTPGRQTVRYGGNTTCVEVRVGGEILMLDAGTGARLFGRALAREFKNRPLNLTLLLTHTHWDHIQGLPFFAPLYEPLHHIRIVGCEGARQGLATILSNQMENPYFPVGMHELPGNVRIEEMQDMSFQVGPVHVAACFANHPGVCVGYRLSAGGRSMAFFPDNEPRPPRASAAGGRRRRQERADARLVEFLRGTDVLIMDAQFDCREYPSHAGWGHGCAKDAVALALAAGGGRLFLFHHDPDHDDAKVAAMTRQAREWVARRGGRLRVDAAREGLQVVWGDGAPARRSRATGRATQ